MKKNLTLRRILLLATGLISAGLVLTAPLPANADYRVVRLNIPGCMS
ncbi:hypothetical protein SAMN04489760_11561 [Syntrophus gentianae]|uniref:Uncharacterized protein n=1 Tax=Syntrophus gentianae TaxID=43775 RepID=A0A1H7YBH5_9BACT|nr:hypothetical protein [Syntrophus gentianae]SEM43542.1 hypothetical protein SAMN04489760_11561 [Syntrophus gentianae]